MQLAASRLLAALLRWYPPQWADPHLSCSRSLSTLGFDEGQRGLLTVKLALPSGSLGEFGVGRIRCG